MGYEEFYNLPIIPYSRINEFVAVQNDRRREASLPEASSASWHNGNPLATTVAFLHGPGGRRDVVVPVTVDWVIADGITRAVFMFPSGPIGTENKDDLSTIAQWHFQDQTGIPLSGVLPLWNGMTQVSSRDSSNGVFGFLARPDYEQKGKPQKLDPNRVMDVFLMRFPHVLKLFDSGRMDICGGTILLAAFRRERREANHILYPDDLSAA